MCRSLQRGMRTWQAKSGCQCKSKVGLLCDCHGEACKSGSQLHCTTSSRLREHELDSLFDPMYILTLRYSDVPTTGNNQRTR